VSVYDLLSTTESIKSLEIQYTECLLFTYHNPYTYYTAHSCEQTRVYASALKCSSINVTRTSVNVFKGSLVQRRLPINKTVIYISHVCTNFSFCILIIHELIFVAQWSKVRIGAGEFEFVDNYALF